MLAKLFVRLKATFAAPAALATTLYEPAVPLAVTVVETAPLAIVNVIGVVMRPAPDAGAIKITCPPFTGSPAALVTLIANGLGKVV